MICKRIKPAIEISNFVKEYVIFHAIFDCNANIPSKSYPINPEEGITFIVQGRLFSETPELGISQQRPQITLFGLPSYRQNLFISHEYLMFHIRFQPGGLFKLLRIPMTELLHKYIDAELVFGQEIKFVNEQLANAKNYDCMPFILDTYILRKITKLKKNEQPIDKIGKMILENPQSFNLEKSAGKACLSHRQFEKRFVQQIGITPKHFSRICRFYQAYELKEHQPKLDWLSIAVQTGYSDYQHLVKDFKEFAGTSPNTFIEECLNNPERVLNIANGFVGA
jgi:AraC-like DNA-binding protein